MQKLGQHFLKNAAILKNIVDTLALADGDHVIEVGPGHGELTIPLLARAAEKKDCSITCIEKDHTLIPGIEALAEKMPSGQLSIIEGDALTLLPEIVAQPPHDARYKIVGNIPYYITGKLLRVISEFDNQPELTALLIQKEVAERICAAPPAMNRLAASVQFWADAEIIAQVPRKDFSPPPDVDSAVIMLKKKNRGAGEHKKARTTDPALYYEAVRAIFAQPRKTLVNNLSAAMDKTTEKEHIALQLQKIGIDPAARPQDVGIEEIMTIAREILPQ